MLKEVHTYVAVYEVGDVILRGFKNVERHFLSRTFIFSQIIILTIKRNH